MIHGPVWRSGLLFLIAFAHQYGSAQEPFADYAKDQPIWDRYFAQVAASYDIRLEKDANHPLEVTQKPVFSYFTQGDGDFNHGTIFLWTRNGRPEAIASFWCRPIDNHMSTIHEMHTLSQEPLRATRNGQLRWMPGTNGLTFKELPTRMHPSETREGRLVQMQYLARQFSGFVIRGQGKDELQTEPPLYRYDERDTAADALDGAVFGLFEKGDPEMFLVLEARESDAGRRWHFAATRLTPWPIILEFNGENVWAADRVPRLAANFNTPVDAYYSASGVDQVDVEKLRTDYRAAHENAD